MEIQIIASTHAPLVLASVESIFSEAHDSFTVFDLIDGKVQVEKASWQS